MPVRELAHREGDGGGLLGLREEFKLLRTALGMAELAMEWGAAAPRKPVEKIKKRREEQSERINGGPVKVQSHFSS